MTIDRKSRARFGTAEERTARRRELAAQARARQSESVNYMRMVAALATIEPHLSGEAHAYRATWLAQRISLRGWFVLDIDDGVRYALPDKAAAFATARGAYAMNPVVARLARDSYEFRTNSRESGVQRTQTFYVGTWPALGADDWNDGLHAWLLASIGEVDAAQPIVYTVDLAGNGFPVRSIEGGEVRSCGPFADPGEACNEFEIGYPSGRTLYVDAHEFALRAQWLAPSQEVN